MSREKMAANCFVHSFSASSWLASDTCNGKASKNRIAAFLNSEPRAVPKDTKRTMKEREQRNARVCLSTERTRGWETKHVRKKESKRTQAWGTEEEER